MITTLAGALDRIFQSHKGQNEKPKIKIVELPQSGNEFLNFAFCTLIFWRRIKSHFRKTHEICGLNDLTVVATSVSTLFGVAQKG